MKEKKQHTRSKTQGKKNTRQSSQKILSITDQMLPELLDLLPRICTRASLLPTLLANSDTCFKTVCPANAVEAHAVAVAITPQNDLQQQQKRNRFLCSGEESRAEQRGSEENLVGEQRWSASERELSQLQRNSNPGP